MECVKVWMNESKVGHYSNQIAIWTSICKYYAAKVNLNMNPACSAHRCMNGADIRFCLLTLHKQGARVALVSSLNEDIHI